MSGALREILASFTTTFDDRGLKKGEAGVNQFTEGLKTLAAGVVAAFGIREIVNFSKEILESADVLAKQSQALSVSAADLQGWQFAAQLSGSSAEEFNSAFTKFNRNVADASKGTGPAADALKELGISAADLKSKVPIDLLDGVADGLAKMRDPAKRTAAVMALFGRSGAKLLPLFQEGSAGIKKLRAEVGELGASFDEAFLQDAQDVNDNVDRLKLGFKGLAIQALKPLLPLIVKWTDNAVKMAKSLVDVVKHTSSLQAGLVVLGTVGAVKALKAVTQLAGGFGGLLTRVLPLSAAFVVLEDMWTFFQGGESFTGDIIARLFGEDAPFKVRAFAKALQDDAGPVLRDVFSILTDGKPLDERLKELQNYVTGTLKAQFATDFGDMADSMLKIVSAAGEVAKAINEIVKTFKFAQSLFTNGPGLLSFGATDARMNDAARNAAVLRDNPDRLPSASDFTLEQQPWYSRAAAWVAGFKPEDAVAQVNPLGEVGAQRAYASPMMSMAPSDVNQTNNNVVNQYFTAETTAEVKKAASEGAKAGVSSGNNDRTKRALVPTAG